MSDDVGAADRYVGTATWDDVPHLSAETKAALLASMPPHQREARSKGVPSLDSGAIYPILEEKIAVDPFKIPAFWPRCYGMDVGWNCTAAVWGAWDREGDIWYLYSEYSQGDVQPAVHTSSIQGRGLWIPGVIDPASRGRNQIDGRKLFEIYENLGLNLGLADNAVEAGLFAVYERMTTGRLKVFSTLTSWFDEYRLYRRKDGKVVKENDHLMDATRYLIMTGPEYATTEMSHRHITGSAGGNSGHRVADRTTGY